MAASVDAQEPNEPNVQGEAQPAPDAPISFDEPAAEVDASKAAFADDANAPLVTPEMLAALQVEANRENIQRDFVQKVMKAREPVEQPAAMPPVADRVKSQTEAEMAAGRKMNEHYAALHAKHGGPRVAPEEGSKAVFRPGDYIPDPKKSQGHVGARNL